MYAPWAFGLVTHSYVESFAPRLNPDAAEQMAQELVTAIEQDKELLTAAPNSQELMLKLQDYALSLTSVLPRVEPVQRFRVCGQAARVVTEAIKPESSSLEQLALADALSSLSPWLSAGEASRLCGQETLVFIARLEIESDKSRAPLREVMTTLVSLSLRMDSMQIAEAAKRFAAAAERDTNGPMRSAFASWASAVAPRVGTELAPQVANTLAAALEQGPNDELARGLASLSSRLEPPLASRVLDRATRSLLGRRALELLESGDSFVFDRQLEILIPQLDDEKARLLARELARWTCSARGLNRDPDNVGLDYDPGAMLSHNSGNELTKRATRTLALSEQCAEGLLEAAARVAAEPYPCRLTTQELVELLKMPTCFGGTRRVVLDHLGHVHGRRFVNHWDFVRFAQESGLNLDLTTPPRRPDPRNALRELTSAGAPTR